MSDLATNQLVTMGHIRGAYGIKGWLRIKADTEAADSLLNYRHWYIGQNQDWQSYAVETGKVGADGLQVKLNGIDERNAAEALRGKLIAIDRQDFAKTADNEWYWVDLIDLSVINLQGELLGQVAKLSDIGAHDLLHVTKPDATMLLIPFVARHIIDVDINQGIIRVDWQADY